MGTLTVHVRAASDLIKADFRGLSDPYAIVRLPGQEDRRTATIKNTLTPNWDERFDFDGSLKSFLELALTIEVYDEDFGWLTSHIGGSHKKKDDHAHHKINKDDKLGKARA